MSQRSRHKRRQRVVVESDDSDDSEVEEYTPSQSRRPSQSQRSNQSQGASVLAEKDVKKLAGQVCNMLLAAEIKKIPVKSSEIKKSIIPLKNRNSYKVVMSKAEEMMEHLFGYMITPVKSNSYILVNIMARNFSKFEMVPKREEARRGLLIAILAAIFMNEGKMSAGGLESFLMDLDKDLVSTSKHTIQEFIRQRYLDAVPDLKNDTSKLVYMWGDRASAEFNKKEILEFVCKVYGNMKPSMWTYQWKLVNEDQNGKETAS